MTTKVLSSSLEDYIEIIYHLIAEKQTARVKDISRKMQVNYSSVTGALKSLARKKLIHYAPYEHVTLTPRGEEVAADVVRRHEALRNFFVNVLAVEEEKADAAACEMEHAISREILERFIHFADFVERCPQGGADWKEGIGFICNQHKKLQKISDCGGDIKKSRKQKKQKASK